MTNELPDDFVEGVITGFQFRRGVPHELLGETLGRRWDVPTLTVRQVAMACLLAMYSPSETRVSLSFDDPEMDAAMQNAMAKRLGDELAARVRDDADAVVDLRAEAIRIHGDKKVTLDGFSCEIAALLMRQHPEFNFDAIAAMLSLETGLDWCAQDAAVGIGVVGLADVIERVRQYDCSEDERRAAITMLTEQRDEARRALGPARTAAIAKMDMTKLTAFLPSNVS